MSIFRRAPVQLSAMERAAVEGVLARLEPALLSRLDLGAEVTLVHQPFFSDHRVLELEAFSPLTVWRCALGPDGAVLRLTGSLANWNLLAERSAPSPLSTEEERRIYANVCDAWTGDRAERELQVERFEDLPLLPDLHPVEQALLDQLHDSLGDAIGPPHYEETPTGYLLVRWILVDRELLCRVLEVTATGRVTRSDEIYDTDLPVPTGEVWGLEGERVVPLS